MFGLKPPRHISTLPKPEKFRASKCFLLYSQLQTLVGVAAGLSLQEATNAPQQNWGLLICEVGNP